MKVILAAAFVAAALAVPAMDFSTIKNIANVDTADHNGNQIGSGFRRVVKSYQACQAACVKDSDCRVGYFIYQGKRQGECWLASSKSEHAITCPKSAPCVSFKSTVSHSVEPGFSMLTQGRDYNADMLTNGFKVRSANLKSCMLMCKSKANCKVGMFTRGECWLATQRKSNGVACSSAGCQSFVRKSVQYTDHGSKYWTCGGTYLGAGKSRVSKGACLAKCTNDKSCGGFTHNKAGCRLIEEKALVQIATKKASYHIHNAFAGVDGCVRSENFCPFGTGSCVTGKVEKADVMIKQTVLPAFKEGSWTLYPYHRYNCGRTALAGFFATPQLCRTACKSSKGCAGVEYNEFTRKCSTLDTKTLQTAGRFNKVCAARNINYQVWYNTALLGKAGNYYHHLSMDLKENNVWATKDLKLPGQAHCKNFLLGPWVDKVHGSSASTCRDQCSKSNLCAASSWNGKTCTWVSARTIKRWGMPWRCSVKGPINTGVWFKPLLPCPSNQFHSQFINSMNKKEPMWTGFRTCHACPKNTFSTFGSRTCSFKKRRQCSHVGCHKKKAAFKTTYCSHHSMPNARLHLAAGKSPTAFTFKCKSKIHKTQVPGHVVVYHHGAEQHGMNHHCSMNKAGNKCSCMCF